MPLDLGFLQAAIERSLAQAGKSEAQGERAKAAQAYRRCAALYRQYAADETASPQEKRQRLSLAEAYEKRAQDVLLASTAGQYQLVFGNTFSTYSNKVVALTATLFYR